MTRDEDAHLIATMMRDQTTIEQLAVSAVTTAITKCPHLSCEISSNDKTPSWDGYIYVHKNERKDKQGLNRVAVQVKGKECVSFSPDSISYSAEVEDLRNYLHNGGVIFFVVELDPEYNTNIFYETLLPVKLQSMLDEVDDDQQHKSFHLKPLPIENNAIETIVQNFSQDAHKQTSFAESKLFTLDELHNNPNVEKITISTTKCGAKEKGLNSLSPFFENEICAYVQMKGSHVFEPIKGTFKTKEIRQKRDCAITSQGIVFYRSCTQIQTKDSIYLKFGDVFEIIPAGNGNAGKLNYTFEAKTLKSKRQSLGFIKAVIESRSFKVDNTTFTLGDENPFGDIDYESQIVGCERLMRLFSTIHVSEDLDLTLLSESDFNSIGAIADSILDNRAIDGISFHDNLPLVLNLKLGNLRLKFVVSQEKGSSDVLFEDYFSSKNLFFEHTPEGEIGVFPTIPASLLTVDEICVVSNFDPRFIIGQLDIPSINNSFSYSMVNELLNNTLLAYDKCKKPQLLEFASDLAKWLMDKDVPHVSTYGKQLDILQIARRSRKLSKSENEQLKSYLSEGVNDQMDLIGIYLLLNKKKEAKAVYKMMNDATRKGFDTSPLHRFW